MSELKHYKLFHRASALTSPEFISVVEFGPNEEVYLKSEADKVIAEKDKEIESITKGAMSMFRESNKCRGLDLKSPLGRIANVAFKHWNYVESTQSKLLQLEKDKEHLKAEIESLKATHYADSVDAGMRERRLRRALYKACANWALSTLAWLDCIDQGEPRKWSEMIQKCRAKMEEYK